MVRKPPVERPDRLLAAVRGAGELGQSVRRSATRTRWVIAGLICYFYTAMFAFGTLGTLVSSGLGPALIGAGFTWGLAYGGRRCMAKARQAAI